MKKGRFHLTKFSSNSRKFLAMLPEKERANPDLNLDLNDLPIGSALGLQPVPCADRRNYPRRRKNTTRTDSLRCHPLDDSSQRSPCFHLHCSSLPEYLGHAGREYVLSTLVRQVLRKCVSCRKRNEAPMQQLMADLPKERPIPFLATLH